MVYKFNNPHSFGNEETEIDPVIPVVDPGPAIDTEKAAQPQEDAPQKTGGSFFSTAKPRPEAEDGPTKETPGACPHCAEADKARLLAMADLENARKRMARERDDFVRYAGENILADILPALDNLDLALAYAPDGKECHNFVVGVDMTRKLLLEALSRHGLVPVGELGEDFDPAKHEAVGMEQHKDYLSGQVCGLMNKGYKLKDRLLRPARVMVCKSED